MTLREMVDREANALCYPLGNLVELGRNSRSNVADVIERVAKAFAHMACAEVLTMDVTDGDEIDDIAAAIKAAAGGE